MNCSQFDGSSEHTLFTTSVLRIWHPPQKWSPDSHYREGDFITDRLTIRRIRNNMAITSPWRVVAL